MVVDQRKRVLRGTLRDRLGRLPRGRFAAAGESLAAVLAAWPEWRSLRWLLGFAATGREPATDPVLMAAAAAGISVAVPRVVGRRLIFHRLDRRLDRVGELESLLPGYRGVREPLPTTAPIALARLPAATMVLVPGAAFERSGRRLGWGGGHYDRALAELRAHCPAALVVGVCMREQVIDCVPWAAHDQAVDRVVSDGG